jgi:four helix bundle protein
MFGSQLLFLTFMNSFTDLEVWKKAGILRNNIFNLVKSFPFEEKNRLTDQIICSIRNNISEGHGRFHYADNAKFLINARGSAAETIDHLFIALDNKYTDQNVFESFKQDCEECMKMINGYISYF